MTTVRTLPRQLFPFVLLRILLLLAAFAGFGAAHAQSGQWTWMGGSATLGSNCYFVGNNQVCGQPGIYGSLRMPSAGNIPGSRGGAAAWTDRDGKFWLFGGWGFDAGGASLVNLDDLWEFDPSTNEWAWMGGSSTAGDKGGRPGVYGKLGTPAAGNIPGSRGYGVAWTDDSGDFWLFGGYGYDADGSIGFLNDLWEFAPSTKEWTWMSGSRTLPSCGFPKYCGQPSVFGTKGSPAAANVPGGRGSSVSWVSGGDLWLIGGLGANSGSETAELDDLWKFNVSTREWTWIGGSDTLAQDSVYGALRVPAPGNFPGDRDYSFGWTDASGNLWLFGGNDEWIGVFGTLDDLWEFSPSTNEWAWMGGNSNVGPNLNSWPGIYGKLGEPAAGNTPGARQSSVSWTYSSGNLWLFGGWGFDADDNGGYLNDLWEFNPSTDEWVWMGGSSSVVFDPTSQYNCIAMENPCGQPGVYGALEEPAPSNIPGGRDEAAVWTDSSGNLWLFGGYGMDSKDNAGWLNDLWTLEFKPLAASPTFSVQAGTYATAQTVSIADTTPGVAIYYTLDGSTPTSRSAKYADPIKIATATTVKAIAEKDGYFNSAVTTSTYYIGMPATPVFSPPPGVYATAQTVKLSDATTDAVIYYTLNGSTPSSNSAKYAGAIPVAQTATLEAIAETTGLTNSKVAIAAYTILKPQTITLTKLPPLVTYGVKPMKLTATASSGLPVTITVTGPATWKDGLLTITGGGLVLVDANQAGNDIYGPAPEARTKMEVQPAPQTITFQPLPSPVTYGVKPIALKATASSGLPVGFAVQSGPGQIDGKTPSETLQITGAGSVFVNAYQMGNKDYREAHEVQQGTYVEQANLTVQANNITIKKGQAIPSTLTYTMSGFVNGDTQATATSGIPSLSTTATSTSPDGTYPIYISSGTLVSPNYQFTFVAGVLTIQSQ